MVAEKTVLNQNKNSSPLHNGNQGFNHFDLQNNESSSEYEQSLLISSPHQNIFN
ncbi:hypothetical protein TTHERM_000036939 (macronuclear) [Tetrahymena thermophila SB210]|uniref:Uncharacterized protein n=1 Tax=Tetrahymena thermophila (strain SB210) TaxID=312017 RepID=W7XC12_TETTS|nr:hypothetical protein TTHERM_000036939 [Tetrahymena thermophila SB210]EWS74887.1 hypothetical protein TTHERM_000036939 [Tetrahymena thermophila SB210]|eukprot:XP_012652600.1 hypothetical protein TTHERM_000036939 [Tetrahymena thermophila SB210]